MAKEIEKKIKNSVEPKKNRNHNAKTIAKVDFVEEAKSRI